MANALHRGLANALWFLGLVACSGAEDSSSEQEQAAAVGGVGAGGSAAADDAGGAAETGAGAASSSVASPDGAGMGAQTTVDPAPAASAGSLDAATGSSGEATVHPSDSSGGEDPAGDAAVPAGPEGSPGTVSDATTPPGQPETEPASMDDVTEPTGMEPEGMDPAETNPAETDPAETDPAETNPEQPPEDSSQTEPEEMPDSMDASDGVPEGEHCSAVADWDPVWAQWEEEVLLLVNEARAASRSCGSEGEFDAVAPLTMDPALRCAARLHSLDMYTRDFKQHDNPDGLTPADRMTDAGYQWGNWGENIAWGHPSPEAAVDWWLGSDAHCSNIMSSTYSELGVGYYPAEEASSFSDRHLWTQNFGTPRGGGGPGGGGGGFGGNGF